MLTDKNKIIGGYSPLCFNINSHKYIHDPDRSSFILSITENDKFQLKKHQHAITRSIHRQFIQFGIGELYITNKANQHDNSSLVGNYNYLNEKYTLMDEKEAYLKFNGNQAKQFKVIQYQFYQVKFQ